MDATERPPGASTQPDLEAAMRRAVRHLVRAPTLQLRDASMTDIADRIERLHVARDETEAALAIYKRHLAHLQAGRLTESAAASPASATGSDFSDVIADLGLNPAYYASTPQTTT